VVTTYNTVTARTRDRFRRGARTRLAAVCRALGCFTVRVGCFSICSQTCNRCSQRTLPPGQASDHHSSAPTVPTTVLFADRLQRSCGGCLVDGRVSSTRTTPNSKVTLRNIGEVGLPSCHCERLPSRRSTERRSRPTAFHASWAQETSLDSQMVSAICPSFSFSWSRPRTRRSHELRGGVNLAVALRATVVTTAYGSDEMRTIYEGRPRVLRHPCIAIVASTGDTGYCVS